MNDYCKLKTKRKEAVNDRFLEMRLQHLEKRKDKKLTCRVGSFLRHTESRHGGRGNLRGQDVLQGLRRTCHGHVYPIDDCLLRRHHQPRALLDGVVRQLCAHPRSRQVHRTSRSARPHQRDAHADGSHCLQIKVGVVCS